jgi:hypothetical protein
MCLGQTVTYFFGSYPGMGLGYWVHPYWYSFAAFVGLNLFQSAFTNWCPMMTFLRKLGSKDQTAHV